MGKVLKYHLPAKWIRRDGSFHNSCKLIDIREFNTDESLIVCCSGNQTLDEKRSNGHCKYVDVLLDLGYENYKNLQSTPTDFVDIIGCVYGTTINVNVDELSEEEIVNLREDEDMFWEYITVNPDKLSSSYVGSLGDEDIDAFVKSQLIPRIVDKNLKLLPIDEACDKLRKVTFCSWCQGEFEVQSILKHFADCCRDMGCEIKDVYMYLGSLMNVSMTPISAISMCPTVSVDSMRDGFQFKELQEFKGLNGIEIKYEKPDADNNIFFERIRIISSRLANNEEGAYDEHNMLNFLKRKRGDWNIERLNDNADCVSQMFAWSLCKAVDRGMENTNINISQLNDDLVYIKDSFGDKIKEGE